MSEEKKDSQKNFFEHDIHKKLLLLRAYMRNLQKSKVITQTGKTKHYKYFELADLIPHVEDWCLKNGALTKTTIIKNDEICEMELRFINLNESKDFISFHCPFKESAGMTTVIEAQNLGASITYTRRYLYYLLLDITDKDQVNKFQENKTADFKPYYKKSDSTL